MFTVSSPDPPDPYRRGALLAIGNFDGVHRGHARLIGTLAARARAAGPNVAAIALTFDPHPAAVLRPGSAPKPLVRTERKAELLRAAGVDGVGVFRTGAWLLDLSAREFFDRVIVGQFAARGLVEGRDFRFGRDRSGDVATLARWCAEASMSFEVVEPILDESGQVISSTRIRRALEEGNVGQAANLLGRPHRVRSRVIRGAGRGAGLGIPTANLDPAGVETLLPADGVYAAWARVEGEEGPAVPAACHVGPNATFGEHARSVEAHLLDVSLDLYDRPLSLDFIERIRGTRAFESVEALMERIREDIAATRRALESSPWLPSK